MKRRELSSGEVAIFCEQMAMILKAGIPVKDGIEMMKDEVVEEGIKSLLQEIMDLLDKHQPLDGVLDEVGGFPAYMVQLVKVGLEAGKLDEVMSLLAQYYDKEEHTKQALRRVLTYPTILFTAMGLVIWVLSIKVLPVFEEILIHLGVQMSGVPAGMMQLGLGISRYFVLILMIVLVGIGVNIYLEKKRGRSGFVHRLIMKSKTYEKLEIQKFVSALALMISSGVDIEYAMMATLGIVEHEGVREKILSCQTHMAQGLSFTEAINQAGLLGNMATRMIVIGTKAGYLDETMQKVAHYYEEEVEEALDCILSKVEPTAIIVLAIIIGSLLMSVMIPLMSMMSAIGS